MIFQGRQPLDERRAFGRELILEPVECQAQAVNLPANLPQLRGEEVKLVYLGPELRHLGDERRQGHERHTQVLDLTLQRWERGTGWPRGRPEQPD
jgi:hypothetical protein